VAQLTLPSPIFYTANSGDA